MIGHEDKLVDPKLLLVSVGKQRPREKLGDTRGLEQSLAFRRVGSNKIGVGRRRRMVAGRLCPDVPQGLKPVLSCSFGTTEVVPSRSMSHPCCPTYVWRSRTMKPSPFRALRSGQA